MASTTTMLNMYITGFAPKSVANNKQIHPNVNKSKNNATSSNPKTKHWLTPFLFDLPSPKDASRQNSRTTLDTSCSTTFDDDESFGESDEIIVEICGDDEIVDPVNLDACPAERIDGTECVGFASNDCVEATLMTSGGVQVTACNNLRASIEMEKDTIQNDSIADLIDSGSQLASDGYYEASLLRYQLALEMLESDDENDDSITNSSDELENYRFRANLCFTCGQLCRRTLDFPAAAEYFQLELIYTSRYTSSLESTAANDLCLAKCYDGLASLYQYDIGDADSALEFYQQALVLELSALDKIMNRQCHNCLEETSRELSSTTEGRDASKPCLHVRRIVNNIRDQIKETKSNIGRIHFQNGNVGHALQIIRANTL
jgi:tetratricopeptide (TPR) repeat protein